MWILLQVCGVIYTDVRNKKAESDLIHESDTAVYLPKRKDATGLRSILNVSHTVLHIYEEAGCI